MARRNRPDHEGNPRYGLSAPGSPWVQELDGPIGIKALFMADTYPLDMKHARRMRQVRAALLRAMLLTGLAIAGGGGSNSGNPDSRLTPEQAKEPIPDAPPRLA